MCLEDLTFRQKSREGEPATSTISADIANLNDPFHPPCPAFGREDEGHLAGKKSAFSCPRIAKVALCRFSNFSSRVHNAKLFELSWDHNEGSLISISIKGGRKC
jgi:hypothetical protein